MHALTPGLLLTLVVLLSFSAYLYGAARGRSFAAKAGDRAGRPHSTPVYHGLHCAFSVALPGLAVVLLWALFGDGLEMALLSGRLPADILEGLSDSQLEQLLERLRQRDQGLFPAEQFAGRESAWAGDLFSVREIVRGSLTAIGLLAVGIGFALGARRLAAGFRARNQVERATSALMITCAGIAIVTTVGIVAAVLFEAQRFFLGSGSVKILGYEFRNDVTTTQFGEAAGQAWDGMSLFGFVFGLELNEVGRTALVDGLLLLGGFLLAAALIAVGRVRLAAVRADKPLAWGLAGLLRTAAILAALGALIGVFSVLFLGKEVGIGATWDTARGEPGAFQALPLFTGTLLIATIALTVAVPVGLLSAIYLAEYAGRRARGIVKPILEILAGVPTVVYGFFAALTVAPFFRDAFGANINSALAAGVVMGVLLIPFVSSLSDDIINAVPQSLRDGSFAMGATRAETIQRIILPAALPGIAGSVLLAASSAIGETMIVVMAAGLAANLTANPLEPVTTVTVQINALLTGDQEFNSAKTLSAFALGLVLFAVTLTLNVIAIRIVQKYRERYE